MLMDNKKFDGGVDAVAKAEITKDTLLKDLFHFFEINENMYKGDKNSNYAIDHTDVLAVWHLISAYHMKVQDQRRFLNTIRELVVQMASNYSGHSYLG